MNFASTSQAVFKVLLAGLVFGAGLPMVFAVGIRLWATGRGDENADGTVTQGNPVALAGAGLAFAIVIGAIVAGMLFLMKTSIKHYLGITVF